MKSYSDIENKLMKWGRDRGILQHGKPLGQAIKTLGETTELIDAIARGRDYDAADALGDVFVTIYMCAAVMNMNLLDCIYQAYDEIKDRKGFLREDGVFVKEV